MAYKQDSRDPLIPRGTYGFDTLGNTIFIGLRTADIFLQYGILARGLADPLLNAINVSHIPNLAPEVAFGLPVRPLVILAMATGSTVKQLYYSTFIQREQFSPGAAVSVSVFNTVFNSISSILSLTTAANFLLPSTLTTQSSNGASPLLIAGTITYTIGLLLEAISETQRKTFKDDPKNAGKAYTGGLFGMARHVNYGGYTIWRASYAFVSGGMVWGGIVGAFFTWDFLNRAVPVLDGYCSTRVSDVCGVLVEVWILGSFADLRYSMVLRGPSTRRRFHIDYFRVSSKLWTWYNASQGRIWIGNRNRKQLLVCDEDARYTTRTLYDQDAIRPDAVRERMLYDKDAIRQGKKMHYSYS